MSAWSGIFVFALSHFQGPEPGTGYLCLFYSNGRPVNVALTELSYDFLNFVLPTESD